VIQLIQRVAIWWASVPAPARDFIEGILSAGVGAGYAAYQGINWASPTLTPTVIGQMLVTAAVGAGLSYARHHFTAIAAAVASGSVNPAPAIAAATVAQATPPAPPAPPAS
jgi:hypothetical protein